MIEYIYNYGDQSFPSGGIDAYLHLHPSSVEGQLDINNDWDTLREQVECNVWEDQ